QLSQAVDFSFSLVRAEPNVPESHAVYCGILTAAAKLQEAAGKRAEAAKTRQLLQKALADLPRGTAREFVLEAGVRATYALIVTDMSGSLGLTPAEDQER